MASSEIQRWHSWALANGQPTIRKSSDGDYVTFADYQAALAEAREKALDEAYAKVRSCMVPVEPKYYPGLNRASSEILTLRHPSGVPGGEALLLEDPQ